MHTLFFLKFIFITQQLHSVTIILILIQQTNSFFLSKLVDLEKNKETGEGRNLEKKEYSMQIPPSNYTLRALVSYTSESSHEIQEIVLPSLASKN